MVHKSDDWRLHGQDKYLTGVSLTWKKYTKWSETWDHDHCEFCMATFMEEPGTDILTEGYTTSDNYHWICKTCFEDFKTLFHWSITN